MENEKLYYNADIKERFLNSIDSPLSRTFSAFPFKKAMKTEENYNKDLYEMSEEQIGEVVSDLSCSTTNAVYNYVTKIEDYIDWAWENGYRKTNINPLSNVDKVEWSKQYVASYRNYYFKREQIIDKTDQLANDMDKAVLLALFEGIKGSGFKELLNLKAKDVTQTPPEVLLIDKDGSERVHPITPELVRFLDNAARQPEYYNKNGENKAGGRYDITPFEDSDKIFKKTRRGKQGGELDTLFVNRKFILFKSVFGYKHLKAKHIIDSGMMHMANELQVDGTIDTNALRKIGDHFNTSKTVGGGVSYRNTTVIRRILEIPEFEELYGYKLKF